MSWPTIELKEVATVRSSLVDPKQVEHRDLPHVGPDSIERDSGRLRALQSAAEDGVLSGKYRFTPGDVLYSKIRPNLNKVTIVDFEGLCSADIYALQINSALAWPQFIAHKLRSEAFLAYAMTLSNRASIPKLNRPQLLAYQFALPPLRDQRRIADILDRADALLAQRRRSIELLDDLAASSFLDLVGSPLRSTRFNRQRLGEVASFVRGVAFKPEQVTGPDDRQGVPCMRTKNVQAKLDLSDQIYIPKSAVRRRDQYLLPGDTLISSANSWNLVGRCCFAPALDRPSAFGAFVSVIRPSTAGLTSEFLYHWFASDEVQRTVRSFGQQTTNISNLNIGRTLDLELPIPPKAVQQKFVESLNANAETRAHIDWSNRVTADLLAGLQHRAFRGEA